MQRFWLGSNEGGVDNYAFYDEPENSLICTDFQSGDVIQDILDENAVWRREERETEGQPGKAQGRKIASIPITVWQNWRRDWMERWSDTFLWQTYELIRLHHPDNKALLTTENPFPSVYERERAIEG